MDKAQRRQAVATAIRSASTDEEKRDVLESVIEAADDPKDVVQAAVSAASSEDDKKDVAAASLDALTPEQRKDVIESMWPAESKDRRWVYMTGFLVAGLVALGLAAIAWAAQDGAESISASLVVLATGFTSAMVGGLLGAYIQK